MKSSQIIDDACAQSITSKDCISLTQNAIILAVEQGLNLARNFAKSTGRKS